MATTGTIYGTASKNWQLKIDYSYTQNVSNNQTTITYTLSVYNNNAAHNNYTNDAYYTLQGTKTYKTFDYSSTKAWHQLGTKTDTITHNADGTKTVAVSAYWYSGISGSSYTPESLTLSSNLTLTTIPRGSTLVKTDFTKNTNYIGSTFNFTITAASNTFTHKIKYKMSGQSGETQIASLTAGTTTYSWTIPTSFYTLCPNSTSLSGTIYLYTYNGNTQIGNTDSGAFTCYVKQADNIPTLVFKLNEGNSTVAALTGSSLFDVDYVVKGYSNITATITATPQNSATITSRKITYNNTTTNYTSSITYNAVATNSWKATVVDSRGYSATTTLTPTLINYAKPTITTSVSLNINPNNTAQANGELKQKFTLFSGSFGATNNGASVYYRYRVQGGSWGSWILVDNTIVSSGTLTTQLSNYSATDTYEFQSKITDKLETITSDTVIVSTLPIFDMSKTDFNFNVPVSVSKQASGVLNEVRVKNGSQDFALHLAASGNKGLWDYTNDNWIISRVASNNRVIIQDTLSVDTIITNGINPLANNNTLTFNNAFMDYVGHTSNAGKDLIFNVRTNRSMANVSTLSLTACKLVVRVSNGYIWLPGASGGTDANGHDFYNDSAATIQVVKVDDYNFYVRITMSTKFENLPNNNTCASVACVGMTVKFNT